MSSQEGELTLPSDCFRLEEINLPQEMSASLAGQTVAVDVLPEVPPMALRLNLDDAPDGLPMVIDEDGLAWNDYWAVRVLYTDSDGRVWRLPRHWLSGGVSPVIAAAWMHCCGYKNIDAALADIGKLRTIELNPILPGSLKEVS